MALFSAAGVVTNAQLTRPGQLDQTGDINATAVAQYSTTVEHTIARRSALNGYVKMRPVQGTNKIGAFGFGESAIQVLVPGTAPDATTNDVGRNTLTVDTVVLTRHVVPLLETFQTSYDARTELGIEDGITIAKFVDQSMFIMAAKCASLTDSPYSSVVDKPAGFKGGSRVTLTAAGDATDPAKLYAAIRDLMVQFENKDVVPSQDDLMLAFKPREFYALQDAEQIVNGDYLTSTGHQFTNIPIFKAHGCPVISSNNVPSTNIVGHKLSTANNGNGYDGDFTKLVGLAFSAKALLAGETIPLTSDLFYDKIFKTWFVDSHLSYGVTTDRAEYAGAIWLP